LWYCRPLSYRPLNCLWYCSPLSYRPLNSLWYCSPLIYRPLNYLWYCSPLSYRPLNCLWYCRPLSLQAIKFSAFANSRWKKVRINCQVEPIGENGKIWNHSVLLHIHYRNVTLQPTGSMLNVNNEARFCNYCCRGKTINITLQIKFIFLLIKDLRTKHQRSRRRKL
jgi:hypothetical protein